MPLARPLENLRTAYGAGGAECDGNNVLDTWAATRLLADDARRGGGPFILTADTFRMGGHATHDEAEARALFGPEVFRHWGRRDPVGTFEAWLIADGPPLDGRRRPAAARRQANARLLEEAEARVTAAIDAAEQEALRSRRERMPEPEDAVRGVYAIPGAPHVPAVPPLGNGAGNTTRRAPGARRAGRTAPRAKRPAGRGRKASAWAPGPPNAGVRGPPAAIIGGRAGGAARAASGARAMAVFGRVPGGPADGG